MPPPPPKRGRDISEWKIERRRASGRRARPATAADEGVVAWYSSPTVEQHGHEHNGHTAEISIGHHLGKKGLMTNCTIAVAVAVAASALELTHTT